MIYGAFDGSGFNLATARDLNLTQATLPIYWGQYPDLSSRRARAIYLRGKGFRVLAHAGVYAFYPHWIDSTASTEQQTQRILDCRKMLSDTCAAIDVVNEFMNHPVLNAAMLFWDAEITLWQRRVNEYGLLTGEITDQFISTLTGNGHLYERIGVQCHVQCDYVTALALLPGIGANLEKLKTLGKPIDISELSIPANGTVFAGWTETRQASYLRKLFAVFMEFSDVIESISWWELKDHAAMFNAGSGLIRANGTKRAAYTAWKELTK